MAKKNKDKSVVEMKSTESTHRYYTTKSKNSPKRMEFKKFDPTLNRHVTYREEK